MITLNASHCELVFIIHPPGHGGVEAGSILELRDRSERIAMKTHTLLTVAVGLAAFGVLQAAPPPAQSAPARVQVVYTHPENFTDASSDSYNSASGRAEVLGSLKDFLVRRGGTLLPAGYRLSLDFTDIKLAGAYEWWHGPRFDDVRIIRSIYPPRFDFAYTVTDAAGKVVKQGQETLTDLNFQMNEGLTLDRSDPLYIEKGLLGDWLRDTLAGLGHA